MVHSRYSRFPHWTYEFEYYFHIAANAEVSRQLFTENRLVRLGPPESRWSRPVDAPTWFAPKSMHGYEIWGFAGNSDRAFRVLVERTTRDLFITDHQF